MKKRLELSISIDIDTDLSPDRLVEHIDTEIGFLNSAADKITINSIGGAVRQCIQCGKWKWISGYYMSGYNKNGKQGFRKTCIECCGGPVKRPVGRPKKKQDNIS